MGDIEWQVTVEVPPQLLAGWSHSARNGTRVSRGCPADPIVELCRQSLPAAHASFWSKVCATEPEFCFAIASGDYPSSCSESSEDILDVGAGTVLEVIHVDDSGWVYGETFEESRRRGFFNQDWIFRVRLSASPTAGNVVLAGLTDWSFLEFQLAPELNKKELKALGKRLKGVMDAYQVDDKKDKKDKKEKKDKKDKKEKRRKEADGVESVMSSGAQSSMAAGSFAEMAKMRRLGQVDEDPKRKAQGLLNKLTPENYSSIKQQIWPFLTTEEQMRHFIQQITQKAVQEHHFIDMYVKLVCDTMEMAEQKGVAGGATSFKGVLLGHCQDIFVAGLKLKKFPPDMQDEELFEEQVKHKVRVTGGAKFIGSLVVQGIGNSKFLFHCTKELIENASPLALETLTALLLCIGPIDNPGWKHKDKLDKVFEKAAAFSTDDKIPTRIQFLLREALDLRRAGWSSKIGANRKQEGPMKLEEVRTGVRQADEDGFQVVDHAKKKGTGPPAYEDFDAARRKPKRLVRMVEVEIEDDPGFQVCKRILGAGGRHLKDIRDACNCCVDVRLRGRGSNFRERQDDEEADEPLNITVTSMEPEEFEKAVALVEQHLADIRQQHDQWHHHPRGGGKGRGGYR